MFRFSLQSKFIYYFSFFLQKLLIPWEVRIGAKEVILAEIIWLIETLTHRPINSSRFFKNNYFETIFGKYTITPGITGTYIVSPAFERTDLDKTIQIIKSKLKKKNKVLFLDVGAYFGTYSIAVGNACGKFGKLDIIAFEPEANNFAGENIKLLKNNITLNKLRNITVYKEGLGAENSRKTNKFGITTKKLDSLLTSKFISRYDTVFMKLDIEGYEVDALSGAERVINGSPEFILMVEDYIDKRLKRFLPKSFKFMFKLTPQNSFWIKPT
jgi:hypothetical protein